MIRDRQEKAVGLVSKLVALLLVAAPIKASGPGSLDPAFDPGSGANGPINSIALQRDGKVLVGGEFTQFGGVPREGIARIGADGRVDPAFEVRSGPNGIVHTLVTQGGGRILVGGEFTGFGTIPRMHLARLTTTGSLDDFDARIEGSPPGNTDAVTSITRSEPGFISGRSDSSLHLEPGP
ncbi:MAG: delta-60 repeat domain-containing protein [Verrucomicrobia bacterium]|nr:delta-60 repeat domain-containing protein [Verrucomicrobiota bacterium]